VTESVTKSLVIAEPQATSVTVTDRTRDAFEEANLGLAPSEVLVLPGNTQPPLVPPDDWHVVTAIDNADIRVTAPDADVLPECFAPTDKDAADITIDLASEILPGKKCITPMTYRVTIERTELERFFSTTQAQAVLASPLDHLDEIFSAFVIQKEIKQGERAGWYTRLVNGILTPTQALDLGILDVTGGDSLVLTLSYYVLDDAILESFVYNGYLIVPDGANDGVLADPIWLNTWGKGTDEGNSQSGRKKSGNGGGCSTGTLFSISLVACCLAAARRKFL
jgi:hypothetical protein